MWLCPGYLSAICHDLDHKGLNNDFLIKTNNPLAIQYNDLSPLENHHLAQSFRLLNRDDRGLLRHLSKDKQVSAAAPAVCILLGPDYRGKGERQEVRQRRLSRDICDLFLRPSKGWRVGGSVQYPAVGVLVGGIWGGGRREGGSFERLSRDMQVCVAAIAVCMHPVGVSLFCKGQGGGG